MVIDMSRYQKKYEQWEVDFIIENLGKLTDAQMAKKLGRSRQSIKNKKIRIGLGGYFDNTDELHQEEVARLVHRSNQSIHRNWVRRGLKFKKRGMFEMVSEKELVKFMFENQDLWDATEVEQYFFEYYPWFHEKLLADRLKRDKKIERIRSQI